MTGKREVYWDEDDKKMIHVVTYPNADEAVKALMERLD